MAINDTEVKVTFDKAVSEDIVLAGVTVTEKASAGKVYIKSVKLAEDKKSLDVVFYDTLKAGKTYDFAIKVGEATVKSSLDFTVGEPADIVLAKQTIGNNGDLEYKVLDKNGLDITKDTTVVVNSDKSSKVTASKGKVTTTLTSETAFVELSYTLKDGSIVKSPRVIITAEADKAAAFDANWTLTSTSAEPNYKAADYKQNTTLNLGTAKFLDVELVDQFGERFADESVVKFETLDAAVAIVDETTGKVTPRKAGKAVIKASILDGSTVVATKVFELNVVDTAKLAGVQVDSNGIDVTKGFTNTIKTTLVDQFGNPFQGSVTVESADTAVATVNGPKTQTAPKGKLDLTVNGIAKGSTTVKITAGDFSQTVKVNVIEAGEVTDYKVEGFSSELLVKDDEATTTDESKMTLSVKSVDANGLTNAVLSTGYTVEVKDANGDSVALADTDKSDGVTINQSEFAGKKGPFTATVKVGTLTVFSDEFVVTDNRVAPKYTIQSNKSTVTSSTVTAEDLLDTVFDFASIDGKTIAITGAEFVSSNEAIINFNDTKTNFVSEQDGSTSIYVDTVDVKVTTTNGGATEDYTLDLNGLKVDIDVIANAIDTGKIFIPEQGTFNTASPFLTTLVLNDKNVQAPTNATAIQSALEAKLASMQAEGYDVTDRDISGITTATVADVKFNGQNIKFSADGKRVEITGPVMSPKAFIVAKGGKNLGEAFNISLFKSNALANETGSIKDADKLAVIQISPDGTAKVVSYPVQ